MIFSTKKSIRTDNFNLKGLNAAASRRHVGFVLWQKLMLSLIAGLVLAFSSPGFDQWWLAWFMVAPLLVLLTKCQGSRQSILCGLFFGMGYHLLSLRFYAGTHIHFNEQSQFFLLIWFGQALLLSLPTMAFAWMLNSLPLRPGYIPYFQRPYFPYLVSVPLLWIFLHRGLAVAHPLNLMWQLSPLPPIAIDALSYSQYSQLTIIQLASWSGSLGVEFLLLLVNAAVASFLVELIQVQDRPVERVDAISPRLGAVVDLSIVAALVGLVYFLGITKIRSTNFYAGDVIVNGLVGKKYFDNESNQPKIPLGIFRGDILAPKADLYFPRLKELAGSFEIIAVSESKELVSPSRCYGALDLLKKIVHQNHNAAITSFVLQRGEDNYRQDFVCMPKDNFQAKRYLLCTNDYLPTGLLPPSLKEWFFLADENNPLSSTMAKISWGNIAILGGSEIANSHVVAKQIRRGASLIICESNIDWTADKCLSKQLLAAAVFRAVENNRYVILSAGDAVVAIIEPSGFIRSLFIRSPGSNWSDYPEKSGIIFSTVQFLWTKTPFTKMWWL